MKFVFYTHSLISDWNHGNAHFLRGVMRELVSRGHEAVALEPAASWSRRNLIADRGDGAIAAFHRTFPELRLKIYDAAFDHQAETGDADVVVVHEWNDPALVARLGRIRRYGGRFVLAFHDTHHRAVSRGSELAQLDLGDYDLVLAFGETLRQRYLRAGWGRQVVTWHEAADDRLFRPLPTVEKMNDIIWVGNWGDGERSDEITTYLVEPVRQLGIRAAVRGVRYPAEAIELLRGAGIRYNGWIANADVPRAFAGSRLTVHIPRRPYVQALAGIPTIRVFEALACGIPLVSAPWQDSEGLFRPGQDFLFARSEGEMTQQLRAILSDPDLAAALSASGLETIRARHTCRHRVDELLSILAGLGRTPLRETAA